MTDQLITDLDGTINESWAETLRRKPQLTALPPAFLAVVRAAHSYGFTEGTRFGATALRDAVVKP